MVNGDNMVEDNRIEIRTGSHRVEFDKSLIPAEWDREEREYEIKIAEDPKSLYFAAISIFPSSLIIETRAIKENFREELKEYRRLGSDLITKFSDLMEEQ